MARAYSPLPHASELWERFDYNPLTGDLIRRKEAGGQLPGTVIKSLHISGYLQAAVNGRLFLAHRLVWVWVTGEDPGSGSLDHKDRNRANNAFHNLRKATDRQNGANRMAKGIKRTRNGKRYEARIVVGYKYIHLGTYDTAEEAGAAYAKAAAELHGEFACIDKGAG